MRPIVIQAEISLDGFISQQGTEFFTFCRNVPDDPAGEQLWRDLLGRAGVHVMGRVTYEEMAPYFASATQEEDDPDDPAGGGAEIAKLMNTIPKAVLSRTLQTADWGPAEILRGDTAAELDALRRRGTGEILVHGGVSVLQSLTSLDVADEYRFNVMPYLAGSGLRPFGAYGTGRELELISSTPFANDVVTMRYRRRR
jgi:dihydrofolate reductase